MKRSLFLIGMPYVGKSHWGKLLAGHNNVPFTDLDDFIEQTAGRTIPDIFSQSGEDIFRALEHQCLKNLLTTETTPQIVACGGGTPCFFNNMDIMKQHGTVVWLNASIPYLLKNATSDTTTRPLIAQNEDPATRLEQLLLSRKDYYSRAHHILQVEDISLTTFDKILRHV
ncbi:MAG: shikimate kinase [Chitinophagaceae bacterium]|nr:shikimate kinase [Chitinophagaceae bacterium]